LRTKTKTPHWGVFVLVRRTADVRDGAGFHDQRSLDNAVKIELDAALDYDVSFTTPRIVTSELTVRSPLSTADRSKGRAEAEAALAG